jgi:OOP family OmpA-OmpF porin
MSRTGDTVTVRSSGSADVTVLPSDSTKVGQVQGVFQARRKEMSMAALIPGLKVKVEGTYNDQKRLVAKSVSFKGNDLQAAEKIEAGMHETKAQVKQQGEALQQHQAQLAEHQAKIPANNAAIEAAVGRFGHLDDYYIFDALTVYSANGKSNVDPKYIPQLLAQADKAKPSKAI